MFFVKAEEVGVIVKTGSIAGILCRVILSQQFVGKLQSPQNHIVPKIREILQKVIDRNIAKEWNTAGLRQNEEVFTMYYEMGGRLITLGSDAHTHASIGKCFKEAQAFLKQCGFTQCHYYKKRKPQSVEL